MDMASLVSAITAIFSPSKTEVIVYFAIFVAYLLIHWVRIFHIFYASARPVAVEDSGTSSTKDTSKIQFVTGIWISKCFSNMSFAPMDLISTPSQAPSSFSMEFYGSREKEDGSKRQQHVIMAGRPDWDYLFHDAIGRVHINDP